MSRLPALLVIGTSLLGCFSPSYVNGTLRCEPVTRACPDGYTCADDGACWRNGTGPDLAEPSSENDLGDTADLSTPGKSNGTSCMVDGDCASAHCVDGVCCNSACTGQCEACDTSATGTCSPVQGPPHGSRSACVGTGTTCGGQCDGSNRASCTYPPTTQICGAACDSHCDGAGTCPAGNGSCPNGYACGAGTCKTSCQSNSDCQTNFMCSAPNCIRVAESDCLDGLDNNGDGKIDCDDPTCAAQVTCVPAPGAVGNEVGLMNQASCPTSAYSTTEPQNQGLMSASCVGCSCTKNLVCQEEVDLFTGNSCGSGEVVYGFYSYGVSVSQGSYCEPVNRSATWTSYLLHPQTVYQGTCAAAGTATQSDPTWTTSTNFCATPRISTNNCGGDATKVCVPKPPSGNNLCVRIPNATGTCPSGYTGSSAVWYSGFTRGSCGSCGGCGNPQASCSGINAPAFYQSSTSNNCDQNSSNAETTNSTASCDTGLNYIGVGSSFSLPAKLTGIGASGVGSGTQSLTCDPPSVTTTPATANGPSTICCP